MTGCGYRGPGALAVDGHPILSRHAVRPKVQAASDRNGGEQFTGIVDACCEGGRRPRAHGPTATGRCGSWLHCDHEPGYRRPAPRPACSSSRSVWHAVTPEPQ